MKLSLDTLTVLKNFSNISTGIYFPGGNTLRIKDSKNRMLAEATIKESLPVFGIADLAKFIGILTIDKDAEVAFKGSDAIVTMLGGKSKINYRGAPKNLLNVPKDTKFEVEKPFCKVTLTKETLEYIYKIVALLGLPSVAIENSGDKYFVKVFDPKDDSANVQTLEVEGKGKGKDFQIIFDQETLKFVDGDYEVSLAKDGPAQFKNTKLELTYWIAPELGSRFES